MRDRRGPVTAEQLPALVDAARAGRARAVARLISLVENDAPVLPHLAALLVGGQEPTIIGLTGTPGVGKSTTTAALVGAYRERGLRVGVLAVDPSSPFSGGALLGDRVRMQQHATDGEVFVRSMATRGRLGGLAAATPQAVRVLAAAGCQVVLVETVGVGQSEVEVAALADTTVVLLAPGLGDGVQAAKAGVLEVGDVFVVNKADRDGADATVRELHQMLALGAPRKPGDWRPPVVRTSMQRAEGLDELVESLDKHRGWLAEHGELERRRERRAARAIEDIVLARMQRRIAEPSRGPSLGELARQVAAGEIDAYAAADRLRH